MIPPEELRHVDEGPRPGERPGGAGLVAVHATTSDDPAQVLRRCREVLRAVLTAESADRLDDVVMTARLPAWFVRLCAPERSPEEAAEWLAWWRGLDAEARARATRQERWSLASWLFWMRPEERTWYWWSGEVHCPREVRVLVEVAGWPAPLGALEWLVRAAGVDAVDVADLVS